ncbi:GGDEF domain-containing protein [Granulicella aggregans]|jgi:diguanylate cyclase (GGDEF)-like protein/PAS domain S-box-containing protein|uniref:GGDEF domain-containing protein n=1 Tax=Granulicella aggregans TaxID=474949 RepID=UPI0021E08737|nr:GGDEF domain-containing protein [Granulicella aggregans]
MRRDEVEIAMKVVDNVDALLGYWDRDLRCRFANAAYGVWFGRTRDELVGLTMEEVLGEPLFDMNHNHALAALAGEIQVFERAIMLPDGSIRNSLASYIPDIRDGVVLGFSVQVTDVSRMKSLELELKEAKRQAEVLATHDFLTGLPNRVLLSESIRHALAEVHRKGGSFGVVAIDFDGFKAINDTYGHQGGDKFLQEMAARMKSGIRDGDTVTRLGGDEFVLLVNEAKKSEDVMLTVRRLFDSVRRPLCLEGGSMIPSLSAGIAVFPVDGVSETELMAKADAALYEAKRKGKNRFVLAENDADYAAIY